MRLDVLDCMTNNAISSPCMQLLVHKLSWRKDCISLNESKVQPVSSQLSISLKKKKKKQILSFLHRPKTSLIYIKGAIVKKTSTDYKYLYDDNMHYMDALNPKWNQKLHFIDRNQVSTIF